MSKKVFSLNNNDKEFSSRCDDIFGGLEKVQNGLPMNKIDIQPMRKRKSNNKLNNTEISNRKSPNKWVRYDLSDISESSASENTGAALSFLHDLEKRKKVEKDEEKEVGQPNQEEEEEEVDMEVEVVGSSNSFKKSHVFQAPECVVGKKVEKKQKRSTASINATLAQGDKVELDHLHENVSAIDFTAEVAARLEQNNPPLCDDAMEEDQMTKLQKFKTSKKKIVQRNVRQRRDSE